MKARWLLAGGALTLLAAGGLVWQRRAAPPSLELSFGCTPGERDAYTVHYESGGVLLDPALGLAAANAVAGPETRVKAVLDGELAATCIKSDPQEHTVALTFGRAAGSLAVSGRPDEPVEPLVRGTTFVTRDARGHVKALRWPASMPDSGRSIVRDLLALGQVTRSDGNAASRWVSQEEDAAGPYQASYVVEGTDARSASLTKTRTRGTEVGKTTRAVELRPRAEVDPRESGGTVRITRATGRIEQMDVTVGLTLRVGQRTVGRTRGQLAMMLQATSRVDSLEPLARGLDEATSGPEAVSDLAGRDVDARLEHKMQEQELGEDTWASLRGKLSTADLDRSKMFLKLKALFLLHPESCAQARRELLEIEDPNDTRFHLVAGALTSAGNKEAQAALVAAARASADRPAHPRALVGSLGLLKQPNVDTVAALEAMRTASDEDLRSTARLALGSAAEALARTDGAASRRLVDHEVKAFRQAPSNDDKVVALLALGNAGANEGVAPARDALADPDPYVRVAGAAALRFVPTGEAEELLVTAATKDSMATVRTEAVRSLSYRVLVATSVEAILGLMRTDTDEEVRMAAVQVLSQELDRDPSLEAALDLVARSERAQGVRNAASMTLLRWRATRRS